MRTLGVCMAVLMGAGLLAGADDPGKPLRGKWMLDKAAMVEASPLYELATPEKQKEIKEKALKEMPDASVEFTDQEVVFASGADAPQRATYRVVGGQAGKIQLEITSKDDKGQSIVDKTTAELGGDGILKLSKDGDPFVMTLRRAK
jgi:hypothetical protein